MYVGARTLFGNNNLDLDHCQRFSEEIVLHRELCAEQKIRSDTLSDQIIAH